MNKNQDKSKPIVTETTEQGYGTEDLSATTITLKTTKGASMIQTNSQLPIIGYTNTLDVDGFTKMFEEQSANLSQQLVRALQDLPEEKLAMVESITFNCNFVPMLSAEMKLKKTP